MLDGLLLKRREKRLLVLGVGELDRARQDIHVLIGLTCLATALLVRLDDEERLVILERPILARMRRRLPVKPTSVSWMLLT